MEQTFNNGEKSKMMSIYDEINLEIQKNNEKIKLFNINPIDLTQKTKIDKFLNTNGFNKALKILLNYYFKNGYINVGFFVGNQYYRYKCSHKNTNENLMYNFNIMCCEKIKTSTMFKNCFMEYRKKQMENDFK